MGDAGSMLTWVTWMACLHWWVASVGGVLAWIARWRAKVSSIGDIGGKTNVVS